MIQLFCAITGLINFLTCTALALFLYFKNRSGTINKLFAVWSANVGLWSLGYFMWLFTAEHDAALLWARILMGGAILIPTCYFHFTVEFLDLTRQHRWYLVAGYLFSFLYLGLNLTPLFIASVEPKYWFRWWPVPGPLYHPFQVYFIFIVVYTHYLLFRKAFTASSEIAKKQFRIVAFGTLIAYAGGSTNFFLWYNIPVPPVFNLLVTAYVVFIAYAILHYKLWDITFIIRKTIVFSGMVGLFVFVFLSLTYFLNSILTTSTGVHSNFAAILSFAIGLALYRPVEGFLVQLTDRFLFQKKFDYQKLLKDASAGMSKIKSLHHLLSLVVHFVTMRVRVKNAAVLVYDEKERAFRFCYPRGYPKNHRLLSGVTLDEYDPLLQFMASERKALDVDRVRDLADATGSNGARAAAQQKYDFEHLELRMRELEARCCVPSFLGDQLRSVLVLGEKKSGEPYTDQDLNVLYTLAQESAIAIENARLYDQAVEKASELGSINEQLNTAQNQLINALSETEIANKKLRDTHVQLIHEQKMATLGRLASSVGHEVNNPLTILSMNVSRAILKFRKNPELKVSEIMDVFRKMEQNISRIKAVVNTLTGLLKKSEHGKFEPLSLKLILEETLPLVQFQTYLDNLTGTEVKFDIPGNIPLIKGDLERLQEVFLNLFINAYHAMMGKRNRKIVVSAKEDPSHPAMVTMQFSDNGSGMPDDVIKKIFNYGFTTKPPGKGSGMGLYMCRYIIELHGGEVRVKSKKGEGATFVITLPAYVEDASAPEADSSK